MPDSPPSLSEIAEFYKCDRRTAARWKAQGAPLGDRKRMRAWLATRKNLPPATKRMLAERANERRARVSASAEAIGEDPTVTGAPAALKRLEHAEIEAYRLLQSALASGDPVEVKVAREGWLKVGDSLRRYDLLVESQRRQSGEMVQRAEVEKHVESFCNCLKLALVRVSARLAPDLAGVGNPADIDALLRPTLLESVINSAVGMALLPTPRKVPEWVTAAALRPLSGPLVNPQDAFAARAKAAREVLLALCDQSAEQCLERARAE